MANEITSIVVEVDDYDTFQLTESKTTMIRYVSNVRARMYYSEPLGSTYEATIRNGNNTIYSTEDGTLTAVETDSYKYVEVIFPKAASNVFYFELKRSGASSPYTVSTKSLSLIDYVFPTCKVTAEKNPNTGTMILNITGNYFSGAFAPQNNNNYDNKNYINVQYRYKEAGTETWGKWMDVPTGNHDADYHWTDIQVYAKYNKYTAEIRIRGLDPNTVYAVEACVTDRVGTITSKIEYGYSKPIFDWSAHDFNFNVPVYTNGAMEINGDLNVVGKITQNGVSTGGGTASIINITAYNPMWTNSNMAASAQNSFTFYIIQPFNLVLLRGYVSGFRSALASSTSYINLCKFDTNFWPMDISALSVSGPKPCNAIMNTDGYIKIIVPEGASTGTPFYITGIYPLSQLSSYYKS